MPGQPKVLSAQELPTNEAKWITLKKLSWQDHDGKNRLWESAERKTRGSSGIDAVAVLAILRSENNSFQPSTVIIEQYRPPIDKFIIELPAGLIDAGETPEQAAIRELEEETGFKADKVLESTPILANDPGMSNANMKLIILRVTFPGQLESPEQKLEAGEHIVKRVVELSKLDAEIKEYESKGFVVDARLSHFVVGYKLAEQIKNGNF
ncbi:hypothetical protein BD410DRAFT_717928 [Rickenella mellea]|uniref:Nudix hydrolase domain-containing protein n=1 Tax=Rickenella mellea TaxID=50990 RepID=A0A4Y7QCY4_9AGAM|nr:hypothetical protein BD410DRAFT_717928 [Rickenella mellea]